MRTLTNEEERIVIYTLKRFANDEPRLLEGELYLSCSCCDGESELVSSPCKEHEDAEWLEEEFTHEAECPVQVVNNLLAAWGYRPSIVENNQPRYDQSWEGE